MRQFDKPNERMVDAPGDGAKRLPDGVSRRGMVQDLYDRVGERFAVRIEPWDDAEPMIDPNGLTNASEADVENALINMKAEGRI